MNSCYLLHLDNMQAPYQTLRPRYLGFRTAVAGNGAIVCTIMETDSPECPAGGRVSLAMRSTGLGRRDRATRKPSLNNFDELQFWRFGYERPKGCSPLNMQQKALQDPWR